MPMSIGQLMKGLIGDTQAGDGKALELKVGQTVRGVLVRMTGDREGIVQINGTPVQAKLETSLEPGKAILLQVQSESADGALVLKQADPRAAAISEASVKAWIQTLGLPDTKAFAALVGELRQDGLALTRDLASQFKAALAAMPEGGDAQSWMRAAALALKRGLPMTGATVGALQQVLAGPPAHALLHALEAGVAAWSGTPAEQAAGGSAQPPGGAAQAAAAKLQALLAEGAALMREAQQAGAAKPIAGAGTRADPVHRGGKGEAWNGAGNETLASAPQRNGTAVGVPQRNGTAVGVPQSNGAAGEASHSNGATTGVSQSNGKASGIPQTNEAIQPANTPPINSQSERSGLIEVQRNTQEASRQQQGNPSAGAKLGVASDPSPTASGNEQLVGTNIVQNQSQAGASGGSWVGQLMKWMGVDHERMLATSTIQQATMQTAADEAVSGTLVSADNQAGQATKALDSRLSTSNGHERTALLFDRNQHHAAGLAFSIQSHAALAGDESKISTAETLKSTLMTLAAGDDVPQQLRDAAQQLVSHITGQQLLLSPEKNGALFSYVTMFVPMKGPDGSQTASVHIQTRRGRKGELDGDNCRLLFDLRMKTLGDTVVDVQVVNRIVNLHVWNDHPATAQLIDSSRDELAGTLAKAGYSLLTLRAEPMPERIAERLNDANGLKATAESMEWSSSPYKGVDIRV